MESALKILVPPGALILALIIGWAFLPRAMVPEYPGGSEGTPRAQALATSLIKAHKKNPVRFQKEHTGDPVQAKGKIGRIRPDGTVEMRKLWGDTLTCSFADQETTIGLNPGDSVVLAGNVQQAARVGKRDGEARLSNCRIMSPGRP